VVHTTGWPLDSKTYGGSFLYHLENNQVVVGYVVGLNYENPTCRRTKNSSATRPTRKSAPSSKAASAFLRRPRDRRRRPAIAAEAGVPGRRADRLRRRLPEHEPHQGQPRRHQDRHAGRRAVFEALGAGRQGDELASFPAAFEQSWLHEELHVARNVKPWLSKGLYLTLMTGIDQIVFRGKAPWTLHHSHADHECLKPASQFAPIAYPKPDGKLTFDRLSSVFISNTNHAEDQPIHLTLKNPSVPVDVNLAQYAGPEALLPGRRV
jgi:electron-transferring-flavoprotein dehydrogenase